MAAEGSKGSLKLGSKKRKLEEDVKPLKADRLEKSESEEEESVQSQSEDETNSENDDEDSSEDEDDGDIPKRTNKPKRHKADDGTESFSNAMGALLNTHLKAYNRADPMLLRQKKTVLKQKEDEKLEAKARKLIAAEKKQRNERSHVTNLLPSAETSNAREILEYERKLKKTAQRGVIKLFNAILTSQVRTENELKGEKLLSGKKEEKVNELSKEKFLDLVKASK